MHDVEKIVEKIVFPKGSQGSDGHGDQGSGCECIVGGKHWDAGMARQPALVRAIKTEMAGQEFRVYREGQDEGMSSPYRGCRNDSQGRETT